jgi:hypothetical protein
MLYMLMSLTVVVAAVDVGLGGKSNEAWWR